jgi:hypothetical protein
MAEVGGEGQKVIDELYVPVDLDKLGKYFAANVPGYKGPITARQFSKGLSNPKWVPDVEWRAVGVEADEDRSRATTAFRRLLDRYLITDETTKKQYVVKRKPPGELVGLFPAV